MNINKEIYGEMTIFDLLIAFLVVIISIFLAKGAATYLRRSLREKINKDHLEIIVKVVFYSIIIIAVLSILAILGVNPAGLLVAGSVAGLVIGFASQSIVGNLVSGLFLIIERPIKIGDQVNINEITGFVEEIRIISTTIRTYDGLYVRIPNQTVFTTNVTNYVYNIVRRFKYVVGIRYSDDANKAIEIIRKVIDDEPLALKNPAPQAFVDNLGDNSVNIIVRIWAPVSDWYSLKMKLLWEIKIALEAQGIEIAFPQRVVWFGNDYNKPELENIESMEK